MTELGISSDFAGQSTKTDEIRNTLKRISEAGFTHVHWCHEWDGEYLYSVYEMRQIREWFQEFGLRAKSLHASKGSQLRTTVRKEQNNRKDYTSFCEYNRLSGVELIQNRLELAYVLGAKEIVLHMYVPYMTFQEEPGTEEIFYRQAFRSFDELMPYARERGMRICLENMLEAPAEEQYKQFDRMFDRYDKEYMGLCLDTGHANVILNQNAADLAKRYQDRIFSVHINDNLGGPHVPIADREILTWIADLHLIPGEGSVDWSQMAEVLAASSYELPLVLELNCHDKDTAEFLRKSHEAGMRLTEQILARR